jgi:sterol desaturase/sphingolipid hydroxylase (fatty acid hydroxylase superfamily)
MTIDAFLRGIAGVLAAMALLALVETALPFSRKRQWRRLHWIPNLRLMVVTLGLNFVCNAGAVLLTGWFASRGFGVLAGAALPQLAITGIGFFALDASTYACHRSMHWLPPLWRAHRVHHSDPLVDVTTSLRQHPIEGLWRFVFIMVPAWAFGVPAETVALYRVVSVLVALTEHMDVKVWEPLDGAVSRVFCTPNMHKVHHSRLAIETDANYGNILSIFDRVLGTFTPPSPVRDLDYGLAGYDEIESQQFGALLRLPFRDPDRSSLRHAPTRGALSRRNHA